MPRVDEKSSQFCVPYVPCHNGDDTHYPHQIDSFVPHTNYLNNRYAEINVCDKGTTMSTKRHITYERVQYQCYRRKCSE
ncbi:hypothetical protein AUR04nite_35210 [Glutamicibacter uratoxydans]|uniref:Uncharacterized protein n=1 Tax=Glutamicibacter uratoxydans TaxID=43667 RepID=A0A4Y4DRM0_GLUUR|nr:hypothetical protein AUR04nite_35210 [Glutamicibacter uratoxydans]